MHLHHYLPVQSSSLRVSRFYECPDTLLNQPQTSYEYALHLHFLVVPYSILWILKVVFILGFQIYKNAQANSYHLVEQPCIVLIHLLRGGFKGGNTVTCHPIFSDMTLQSQILVVEPFFLWISKFIRKYFLPRQISRLYSSCCNLTTSSFEFSDNFFSRIITNKRMFY